MNRKYNIIELIYRNKTIDNLNKKINLLGINNKFNTINYLTYRLIITISLFIILLYTTKFGYIIAPLSSIVFYILIEYLVIDRKLKEREISLEREAITFFEILSLSLDAGRNLESALKVTINNTNGLLKDEFNETFREVKYGKSLQEAMIDMQLRIPSDNINNIILSLIESDIYGTSIIENLHSQIEYLRDKRRMQVKAEIDKLPVKISIVSVLFFVPLMLLIILGPIILLYIE